MKVNTAASGNMWAYGEPIQKYIFQILCLIGLLFPTVSPAATFNLVAGWNLVGNSSTAAIDVANALGDTSKITSVWKWNRGASKWAFYAPSMSAASLLNYTQAKGYDVLTSIDSKEGFWVNVISPTIVVGPAVNGVNLTELDILVGWNLVSSSDSKTPSQLNAVLSGSLNGAGKTITTTWAWDTSTPQWRFYAPALEAQGATVLSDYQAAKGYLPFSAALSLTDGYWVNASAVAATGNTAPVANAGVAQNVVAGSAVTLDGSTSSDANSDPLTYAWTLTSKPAGSTAALSSATSAKPTFKADAAGTYVASLTVNDGKVNSTAVTVSITAAVANVAPVANAGVAQNVVAGSVVTLDGSASSDANGDTLTYTWTLTSKPAGSTAVLSSTTSAKPTFTADVVGTYVASLTVSDGKVNSATTQSAILFAKASYQLKITADVGTVTNGAALSLASIKSISITDIGSGQIVFHDASGVGYGTTRLFAVPVESCSVRSYNVSIDYWGTAAGYVNAVSMTFAGCDGFVVCTSKPNISRSYVGTSLQINGRAPNLTCSP